MTEPVILPRLEGDPPFCTRVNLEVFKFVHDLAAALRLEHAHGYNEMHDELWLRISHDGMRAVLQARPV